MQTIDNPRFTQFRIKCLEERKKSCSDTKYKMWDQEHHKITAWWNSQVQESCDNRIAELRKEL